ncbi:LamB/YcsF family protein [Staphylococcus aureus]
MNETVKLAKAHNVAVGAHPGLPDLKGFGRRNIDTLNDEIYNLMVSKIQVHTRVLSHSSS